jgi:uncharacterized delta-60 repeat protein
MAMLGNLKTRSFFTFVPPGSCALQARISWVILAFRPWFRVLLVLSGLLIATHWSLSQTVDSFNPVVGTVYTLAIQPDGKILVCDSTNLWRLSPDGTRDTSFASNSIVPVTSSSSVLIQPDGRILVAGSLIPPGKSSPSLLARLNLDGTPDTGFDPNPNGAVYCMTLQSDGSVLLGGVFTNVAGRARNRLARLNPDGTLDTNFNASVTGQFSNPLSTTVPVINSIAIQPDNQILVGGMFTSVNGSAATNLARLNPDGTFDGSFSASAFGLSLLFGAKPTEVLALAVQPDRQILVGGTFTNLSGMSASGLGRLNPDGTPDVTFQTSTGGTIQGLLLQTDGRIIVGGQIGSVVTSATNTWRLNTNGTRDTSFNLRMSTGTGFPAKSLALNGLAVQPDGKLILGGSFTSLNSTARTNLGRVNNTSAATESLSYDGTTLTWLRGGTSPEIGRATFEFSTNGEDWTSLGAALQVGGGWQLTVLSAPTNTTFRARGFVDVSQAAVCDWFLESSLGPPAISLQPLSRTNNAGTVSGFSVQSVGSAPLSFQWLKNGANLTNSTHVTGAQTPTLSLSNVFGADGAGYSVVVSNNPGSVTSQVAILTVIDPLLTKQPVSISTNAGQTATFTVAVTGTAPLSYQWRKNAALIAGASTTSLTLTNVQRADAASYDVMITNAFGSITSSVAMLTINLATFDPFGPAAENTNGAAIVAAMALQPDGKLLLGGNFTSLGGQPTDALGRLNTDGSGDPTFNGSADSGITGLAVQEDGRILAGGYFYTLATQSVYGLGRLNQDGTLDAGFTTHITGGLGPPAGCFALTADGEIMVGGAFGSITGGQQRYLARLFSDGTVDNVFAPNIRAYYPVYPQVRSVTVQSDDNIIAVGAFNTINSLAATNLVRLFPNGALDTGFLPQPNGPVYCMSMQPDGKLLVGGAFTSLGQQSCTNLGRINADGTLDTNFAATVTNAVYSIALQTDGKLIVAGVFTNLDGQSRKYAGRLNSDGSLDPIFDPRPDNPVYGLLLQPDGKVLLGGTFTNVAGQKSKAVARINNTDPASQTLSSDGTSITWLRGGTSPEVWRTRFAISTNGADWTDLGPGTRIPGGWQLTGLALPPNPIIRARGFVSGGEYNGSSSIVETYLGPTIIVSQPLSRTNNAGTLATFQVLAGGSPPLSYQWLKNGAALSDVGNISGTRAATLSLSNVLGGDAGAYDVLVSNASGSATSSIASLTVVDPLIVTQPTNQYANAGQSITLSVTAIGTLPLHYQWRQNGQPLATGTASALPLPNLQRANAGAYDVIVGNVFGSLTSSVAPVSVNLATTDGTFNPQPDGEVDTVLVQPDGKIVLGGWFTTPGGGQSNSRVARLNPDGTPDPSFQTQFTGDAPYYVTALALQFDGSLLVGGGFYSVNGQPGTNLARLFPNGALDTSFMTNNSLPGADSGITGLIVQPDRRILVSGYFVTLGGVNRNYLGRLLADGTVDAFNPAANGNVFALALQPDGKVLAGGAFTSLAGQPRNYLGRLNPDGTLDNAFDPGASNWVYALAVQADGKILVGGSFTNLAGQSRTNLARLNADGSLDTSFNPGANNIVDTFALQSDGKILVGGRFTSLGGQSANYLCRLNPDGSRDSTFLPTQTSYVTCLAAQPDGKLIVGGSLYQVLGRLNATDPATQNLAFSNGRITWSRDGSSPDIWRAWFDTSTDGTNWNLLGEGLRVAGAWQLGGVSFNTFTRIRARGSVAGGYFNGSSWYVEATIAPPFILSADGNLEVHSNHFGFNTRGAPGQVVLIEASTNLLTWVPVQTNIVTTGGVFFFSDPDSSQFAHRFYRARLFAGTLPPPSLLFQGSGVGVQAGGFSFGLAGVYGQTILVEASTDLLNWTPIATNVLTANPIYFTDSASTNFLHRFYRARVR